MTRDEKIEFHSQVAEIEKAVKSMNGPYMQTGQILVMLGTLREAWLEDAIYSGCESCEQPILESELETATMTDDGCWICAPCVERWNSDAA